jgi:hypothetical protein
MDIIPAVRYRLLHNVKNMTSTTCDIIENKTNFSFLLYF